MKFSQLSERDVREKVYEMLVSNLSAHSYFTTD